MIRRFVLVGGILVLGAVAYLAGRPWLKAAPPAQTVDVRAMNLARIRVITANIRFADPKDGENAWLARRDLLVNTLLVHEPDLIGFQEVTPAQGLHLQRGLKDFGFVSCGDNEDLTTGLLSGLDTLAYRKDRFTVEAAFGGLIRPDALQTVATENAFFTLAILKDTHKIFPDILFLNTHIRHDVANAVACTTRLRAMLAEKLKDHPGGVVIVTGDMNHDRMDPSYAALLSGKTPGPALADTFDYAAKNPQERWGTYHAFTGKPAADLPTDLIFEAGLKGTPAEILMDHTADGHYPTDHFLVMTDLTMGKGR